MRRLETLLVLSVVALLLQLIPLPILVASTLDPRGWPREAWIGLNITLLAFVCWIRFGRDLTSLKTIFSANKRSRPTLTLDDSGEDDSDYITRCRRDDEWRERARKRLPFT